MIDLRLGDIYQEIHNIPNNSVDLIIIDPPYDMQEFGQVTGRKQGTVAERFFGTKPHLKELEKQAETLRGGFDYRSLFEQFERIQPFRNMYIFCNARLLQKLLAYFNEIGFNAVDILVYQKNNPIPSYKFHYLLDIEYCLFVCDKKSSLDFGTENPMWRSSHFYRGNISGHKLTSHPTEKPLELIEKLVLNSSREGEMVLDCFSGSGTTAHACKIHNRNFIGYEIQKEYHELAQKRLATQCQGKLL